MLESRGYIVQVGELTPELFARLRSRPRLYFLCWSPEVGHGLPPRDVQDKAKTIMQCMVGAADPLNTDSVILPESDPMVKDHLSSVVRRAQQRREAESSDLNHRPPNVFG